MKLVTIGIPFFNNEKTLSYAIKSTINQTYPNLEILLIDDGSTDSSLKIAQSFAIADSRIKIISDSYNKGLIARLNQIIQLASGEFIARMDADDMMTPDRISKQVSYFEENPIVDVLTTGIISLDKNLMPVGKRCCSVTAPNILNVFRNGEDLIHASMMTRSTWAKMNLYKMGFERAEDRELFTRTIKSSVFKILPEPLYFYVDVQNMTLDKYLKSYRSERKVLIKNWQGSINFTDMIRLLIRSYVKSIVIRLYFLIKIEDKIFRNKNRTLNPDEINFATSIIQKLTN